MLYARAEKIIQSATIRIISKMEITFPVPEACHEKTGIADTLCACNSDRYYGVRKEKQGKADGQ